MKKLIAAKIILMIAMIKDAVFKEQPQKHGFAMID
jgi:hypothetical protein